jgi:hypothetical protein
VSWEWSNRLNSKFSATEKRHAPTDRKLNNTKLIDLLVRQIKPC